MLGWLTTLVLALLLYRMLGRSRVAVSEGGSALTQGSEIARAQESLRESVKASTLAAQNSDAARQTVEGTREEFAILRAELQQRMDEAKAMKLGSEFHARRPLLLALARVATMISGDRASGIATDETVAGVLIELEELMDEHRVRAVSPEVGGSFDQVGIDMRSATYVETDDDLAVGKVAGVDQPALIYYGPEAQDVLIPARVRVYRKGAS